MVGKLSVKRHFCDLLLKLWFWETLITDGLGGLSARQSRIDGNVLDKHHEQVQQERQTACLISIQTSVQQLQAKYSNLIQIFKVHMLTCFLFIENNTNTSGPGQYLAAIISFECALMSLILL